MEQAGDWGIAGRQRVEAMMQTLASLGSRGESLAEVAHDARNMVTALGLYCDLLEEPGVLAVPFAHYGSELRLVAAASRRLVEKLVALDAQEGGGAEVRGAAGSSAAPTADLSPGEAEEARANQSPYTDAGSQDAFPPVPRRDPYGHLEEGANRGPNGSPGPGFGPGFDPVFEIGLRPEGGRNPGASPEANGIAELDAAVEPAAAPGGESRFLRGRERGRRWERLLSAPVENLAAELLANRNLLSALAGPGIAVTVDAEGGARPVRLAAEDLTRLLVNLVKNASEAVQEAAGRGHIQISLRECAPADGAPASILLAVEDNGPGIPAEALGRVFDSGFTTHARNALAGSGWPVLHRGLGLAIARSIAEAAGGCITASNREQGGARIALELPVRAA